MRSLRSLVCFRCTQIRDGHYPESRKGDISRHLMANTVCPFCLDDIDQDIDQDIDMRGSARANVSRMSDTCQHCAVFYQIGPPNFNRSASYTTRQWNGSSYRKSHTVLICSIERHWGMHINANQRSSGKIPAK
jgi:hypothetical protein